MTELTESQLKARKRLLEDFEFYAKHCVKIRTKKGKITNLVLNRVQKRFVASIIDQQLRTGRVRFVVLKARQQGLSTVISAWQYWWLSQRKAQKGLVMAHEGESTTTLFDMYKRIHDNVPDIVRPSTKYSSRSELVFDKLDSALRVATAGGRGVARGETLTVAHLSEVAFWPPAFANTNFNGLVQAIPEEDGTAIFLESTAQGVTGKFYEMYQNAVRRDHLWNGYEVFFSAWVESEEYRETAPADFVRTPEEDSIAVTALKLYDIVVDNAQLYWRRKKVATNGLDLFKQEYPLTADEAFLSTGRPIFDNELITNQMAKGLRQVVTQMAVEETFDHKTNKPLPLRVLNEHPRGELKVYHPRVDGEVYVIGADVGMGLRQGIKGKKDGDPSVAQILDSQMRQVAVWRGLCHPDVFAKILETLGYHYNSALVIPERNNHGLVTCVALRNANYPYLYTDQVEGTLEPDKDTIKLGFFTSEATKPLIIDKLRALQREGEIEINDETTLKEMMTFVVNESGKMEAEAGTHDDTVMALALAAHAHEGKWKPVEVTDEFYVDAI
ncbi:hypothetical protein [Bradyrhizobium sp. BR 10289]|uniref:hypothetical protein n=1 Tax=Bradyrhizobium sp. BR 10289 TaxID=2749993 RepID=UPI001C652F34|nr:hypothetical protein [Bradyrhizobium sp. BR 10289]MBW7970951.1 hypothetical protein [Bradyrhizobium sp. BR 10289]